MAEQPYLAESDLQGYLAAHPELLSAEAAEDERRRWLLVRREMGGADREGGTDRWSLDHPGRRPGRDSDLRGGQAQQRHAATPRGRRPDAGLRCQRFCA